MPNPLRIRKIRIDNPNNYYIFSPSYDYNKDGTWSERSDILNTLRIIEDAKEIHVIDSSFFCLINMMKSMENNKVPYHYYGR